VGSNQRRRSILKRISEDGYAEVKSLAHELGVDSSTIRRDLLALADQGRVVRTHGGAKPVTNVMPSTRTETGRREANLRSIAHTAAAHIRPGEMVIIDGGDAGLVLAEAIQTVDDLTILTNDLHVASTASNGRGARVVMTGGELFGGGTAFGGERAVNGLTGVLADWAFVCADGIEPSAGITSTSSWHAPLKLAFTQHAQRACVLVESSQFGRRALSRICGLADVHLVITDATLPDGALPAYGAKVVRGAELAELAGLAVTSGTPDRIHTPVVR
jgi:DeoR family transcriptional regulator, aga operon transcriptional repressor